MRLDGIRSRPWTVPLACALVPAAAVHIAWALSLAAGLVPSCNPYLDGCVSVSRAARQGTGNLVFKLLMVPAAALQVWHWELAAQRVADSSGAAAFARGLRPLGIVAGVALAVYALFLGTEGGLYGWLRRYGITFYFAATFLAMVVYLRALGAAGTSAQAMTATCVLMLALGVANTFVQVAIDERARAEQLRDAMEWQLCGLISLWFALNALCWRRWKLP